MARKRSIFEDVGETGQKAVQTPQPGLIDRAGKGSRRGLRLWLILIFLLVCAMILLGGLTRLTDSGLSITEWKPVTGALPPMNAADWQAEFDHYKKIPEFSLQNKGMTLAEFKSIFWWEWSHRQLGRFIGLVWGIGFLFFWLTRRIPGGWTSRLLGLGALGGFQGAVGWWMVSSGLTGRMVDVASYRLAIHLAIAFAILGLSLWYILLLGQSEAGLLRARRAREGRLFAISTGLMHLAFLQIILGALVAGIDAGRGYIDWPLMNGQFIPDEVFDYAPWWSNFFENPALVQFNHRMVGYLVVIFAVVVWRRARRSGNRAVRGAFTLVLAMAFLQMLLGIGTVMSAAQPHIAFVHQFGAIVFWSLILRARFTAAYPPAQSIQGK